MKKSEAAKLLIMMRGMYPTFMKDATQEDMDLAVEAWSIMCDYSFNDMMLALKARSNASGSAFAPSMDELKAFVQKTSELPVMDASEAWSLVDRAIRNSAYNAQEEFDKLPPMVQKAVGSANMLHSWAGTDVKTIDSVIASNFQKAYRTIVKRDEDMRHMPPEAQARLAEIREGILALKGDTKNE